MIQGKFDSTTTLEHGHESYIRLHISIVCLRGQTAQLVLNNADPYLTPRWRLGVRLKSWLHTKRVLGVQLLVLPGTRVMLSIRIHQLAPAHMMYVPGMIVA
jgi:hypothetical protein